MGIRVTKVLGYGLTDVKTRKWSIADGRINRKSPLLDYDSKATLDDYLDWLKATYPTDEKKLNHFNMDMWLFREREEDDFDWYKGTGAMKPNDLIHHGIEYMEKNVLLIRPLSCKDWQRYDDPIDYVEESFRAGEDSVTNWTREIPGGIFPYNGSFMNAKTGERVQTYGFDNAEDARVNLVPVVPNEVRDLCEWGKLFTNDDVWKQLRPMIYTYWS